MLLDQSKAFDLVNHELLLAKIKYIVCYTEALKWFRCYLCERLQSVSYRNHILNFKMVKSDVLQGSA